MWTNDRAVAAATLEFLDSRKGTLLLHAGGAASADGKTVVVHGESGAGKTTLTAAIVTQGLAYITDETVCLNPRTLAIEPFRKPLTVKPGSQEVLAHLRPSDKHVSEGSGNWQLPPEDLGGPGLPKLPLRPAVIIFPEYDEERIGVDVAPVSGARAAFVLGEQSSAMWTIEPRPLAAVARLVSAAPAFRVGYSNAFAAAAIIVDKLLTPHLAVDLEDGSRHAGVSGVSAQDQRGGGVSDAKQKTPSGTNGPRRASGVDWLVLDGEAVLFDGEHLHHLDPPGAAIWQRLDGERTLQQVSAEITEAFQADAQQVMLDVEDLVRVLRTRGLVSVPR